MIFQSFTFYTIQCVCHKRLNGDCLLVRQNNLNESWFPHKYESFDIKNVDNEVRMKKLWILQGFLQCNSHRLKIKNRMWISWRSLNKSYSTRRCETRDIKNIKKWSSYAKVVIFRRLQKKYQESDDITPIRGCHMQHRTPCLANDMAP